MSLPADIDQRLWIRTSGCGERDFLVGNSHTFPGRMEAYCPHAWAGGFSVSKLEITEASPESLLWIEGFLRGNAPSPPENDNELEAWRSSVAEFVRTGAWPQED